jgi:hypothetical protein
VSESTIPCLQEKRITLVFKKTTNSKQAVNPKAIIYYLQKRKVLRKKFIKFFRDENPSNIEFQKGLVAVIILIKVMWSFRWNKQNCLELNIALSIEMSPCQWLVSSQILLP